MPCLFVYRAAISAASLFPSDAAGNHNSKFLAPVPAIPAVAQLCFGSAHAQARTYTHRYNDRSPLPPPWSRAGQAIAGVISALCTCLPGVTPHSAFEAASRKPGAVPRVMDESFASMSAAQRAAPTIRLNKCQPLCHFSVTSPILLHMVSSRCWTSRGGIVLCITSRTCIGEGEEE